MSTVDPVRMRRIDYGDAPEQFGELWKPRLARTDQVVVVLVHGGYWRNRYDLTTVNAIAADLAHRGYVVWNIEYRRVGDQGGGWPGTFDDVVAAVDHLRTTESSESEIVLIGHSAGGHLALWSASHVRRTSRSRLRGVVGLGALTDLRAASDQQLSDGAADELLGTTPDSDPERFAEASVTSDPPTIPTLLVRARGDVDVPADQAELLRAAAEARGTPFELIDVDGDHFDLIDPHSEGWGNVVHWIDHLPRAESLGTDP